MTYRIKFEKFTVEVDRASEVAELAREMDDDEFRKATVTPAKPAVKGCRPAVKAVPKPAVKRQSGVPRRKVAVKVGQTWKGQHGKVIKVAYIAGGMVGIESIKPIDGKLRSVDRPMMLSTLQKNYSLISDPAAVSKKQVVKKPVKKQVVKKPAQTPPPQDDASPFIPQVGMILESQRKGGESVEVVDIHGDASRRETRISVRRDSGPDTTMTVKSLRNNYRRPASDGLVIS